MVPDIKRKEWADIINGSIKPKLTVLSLDMKLSVLRVGIKTHQFTLDEAIVELHRFISLDELKFRKDLNSIFNIV